LLATLPDDNQAAGRANQFDRSAAVAMNPVSPPLDLSPGLQRQAEFNDITLVLVP